MKQDVCFTLNYYSDEIFITVDFPVLVNCSLIF